MEMCYMAFALIYGIIIAAAYRKGLCDGLKIVNGKEPEPMLKKENKAAKTAPVFDARTEAILQNIDNYDGTAEGQVVIE